MRVFRGTIGRGEERIFVLREDGTENANAVVIAVVGDLTANNGVYKIIGDAQDKIMVASVLYRNCVELHSGPFAAQDD